MWFVAATAAEDAALFDDDWYIGGISSHCCGHCSCTCIITLSVC